MSTYLLSFYIYTHLFDYMEHHSMFQLDTNTYKHSPPKNEVEKQLHLEGNKHQIIIKYKVPNAVIFTLCQT